MTAYHRKARVARVIMGPTAKAAGSGRSEVARELRSGDISIPLGLL